MPGRKPAYLEVGTQVVQFLQELEAKIRREIRLECATKAVHVASDWAAQNSMTCHPDAARVCEDLGEEIRKAIMGGE